MSFAVNGNLNRRDFLNTVGLGAASVAIQGCTSAAKQPTTDVNKSKPNIVLLLAEEGLQFKLAFTPTAMCSPSRSALYTGLYPHRNGCHPNHSSIKPGIKSLPHYLKPLGYRIALAGKTHIKPREQFPFEYMRLRPERIEKFMTLAKDKPFCLVVASHEPHGPHKQGGYKPGQIPVPPYKLDTPQTRQQLANYYTDIDLLDKEVGGILGLLKKHNLEQNTLFVYASDHGYNIFAKWSCYDAGLHVPFIVRWPGKVKPGTITDAMVSFVDVLPTFIEAAGGKPPGDIDGRSFLPVLLRRKKKHHDAIFGAQCVSTHGRNYTELNDGVWGSWKEKARTDTFAAERVRMYHHRPAQELYDLTKDPYELKNIADDPAQQKLFTSLRKKLDAWMKQQGDRGMEAEMAVPLHKSRTVRKRNKRN